MHSKEGSVMKNSYYIAIDDKERGRIIQSLNNLRNNLINQGKYTDGVDDVLVKITSAKKRNFKIIYTEV